MLSISSNDKKHDEYWNLENHICNFLRFAR